MVKNWEIIEGKIPILLVASHNFPHIREGKIKPRDLGTGNLVELLCKQTNTWGIISTSVQIDPNWYIDSAFRKQINHLINNHVIKFVIDIHGRKENYPHLLEILPNKTFRKSKIKIPKNFHQREFVNNEQLTLAENLDNKSVACVEIEIKKDGRIKKQNNKSYEAVVKDLIEFINVIIGKLEKNSVMICFQNAGLINNRKIV